MHTCIFLYMADNILYSFGNKLRSERLKLGLSQEKFAELTGLHRTYIGMIERGEKNITIKNIKKISLTLNMTMSELFDEV